MTKYAIMTYNDGEWEDFALFSDKCTLSAVIDFALNLWGENADYADVAVTDNETGEVLWNAVNAEDYEDYDEPGDIDDDCGFDPYMGCFSDDC